jgi:4-aminobutyrate aminotransferase-like enzyme
MAENASSAEQVDNVSITVLVEKGKNKVVYAEAGKDFVDALFSFLTFPLGTIARLVAKEDSNMEAVQFVYRH